MGGKNNKNNNIIEVYADNIYYAIVGSKSEIDNVINILRTEKVESYVEYMALKTNIPLAKHKEKIEHHKQTEISLDPIVEEAHACAHSCFNSKSSYMIVCLKIIENHYILTFPRYIMVDGDDPEKGLIDEFNRLSRNKLNKIVRSTIRPYDIIGRNRDAILYISVLSDQVNKISDKNIGKNIINDQHSDSYIAELVMLLNEFEKINNYLAVDNKKNNNNDDDDDDDSNDFDNDSSSSSDSSDSSGNNGNK